jgi:hypothetical protein
MKRRFRYRLSTLLSCMFLVALSAAAYGHRLRVIERQQKALQRQNVLFRRIAAKGGRILDYEEGAYIDFQSAPFFGLCGTGLRGAFATGDPVTFGDADMPLLDQIVKIRTIDFTGANVSEDIQKKFKASHNDCRVNPEISP